MASKKNDSKPKPAPEKGPAGTNHSAAAALHKFADIAQECLKYETLILDAAKEKETVARLKADIEEKRKQIEVHPKIYDELLSNCQERVAKLVDERNIILAREKKEQEKLRQCTERVEKLMKENEKAEEDLATKSKEMTDLEQVLGEETAKAAQLVKDLESSTNQIKESDDRAQAFEEKVKQWESYQSDLKEVELTSLSTEVANLCDEMNKICDKFFKGNLPIVLHEHNEALLARLRELEVLKDLPFLPTSTSEVAKNFRMAIAFGALTALIMDYIFVPTFSPRDEALHDFLLELAETDSTKESLCRALLLSLPSDKEELYRTDQAQFYTAGMRYLGHMVMSQDDDNFKSDLRRLGAQASEFWDRAQHATKRIEASIEEPGYNGWQSLELVSGAEGGPTEGEPTAGAPSDNQTNDGEAAVEPRSDEADEVCLVLFPVFYEVIKEEPFHVFSPGLALRKSQMALAEQEWKQSPRVSDRDRPPTTPRRVARRHRQMSMSNASPPSPFLGSSPQS